MEQIHTTQTQKQDFAPKQKAQKKRLRGLTFNKN
jgi:hypothetical protein|tara:strand:- start:92 stop:193 length:102 start_codon:yes stop_codon:yes gene_type:complete